MLNSQHKGTSMRYVSRGRHFVSLTLEAFRTGIWQAGDWSITVSGIALERLQAGDLLFQERNEKQTWARKRKNTPD